MKLLFLNSMEKQVGEGRARSAQVSVGESKGRWFSGWQETKEDGKLVQETWYEGTSWDELQASIRRHLIMKQHDGFKPMLRAGLFAEAAPVSSKSEYAQLLHYYSEENSDEKLYEELRQWRLKQASKEGKSPFLVATNRLLRMICAYLPQTPEELNQLPGFGPNKAAMYGAELIQFTQNCTRTTSFPLDWVEAQVNLVEFHEWKQREKERRDQAEQNKRELKSKLLEAISRGDSLELIQDETKLQRRDLAMWIEELDREGYDLDSYIEAVLQGVPDEELQLAWDAFELQGDRFLKPVLQTLYKQDELDTKQIDTIYEWLRLLRIKFRRIQNSKTTAAAG
ncbi:HRDC domain-containing protein [Paenibacillus sp. UNC451MF]|uniref:HRDC domain-containing protein n=1 Tax=Paenibacillus sp. UNC451MF TaxID=1449063 RepID=UPI00049067CA|nr:HRDC domain-containing protein [Paenibacillus sp. UNC451MF]